MEYNTRRSQMHIPEYGRNVHKMIELAKKISDTEERKKAADSIIKIMRQVNTNLVDIENRDETLWTHLFIMANFDFEIESPYTIPQKEILQTKPEIVPYPNNKIRFGHYGKNLESIISETIKIEDEEQKHVMMVEIANLMKRFYLNWNRDSVDDQLILDQLKDMSGGKLFLKDINVLKTTNNILRENYSKKKKVLNTNNPTRKNFKQTTRTNTFKKKTR